MANGTSTLELDKAEFKQDVKNLSFQRHEKADSRTSQSANYVKDKMIEMIKLNLKLIEDTQKAMLDSLSIDSILPKPRFTLPQDIKINHIFSLPNYPLNDSLDIIVETDDLKRCIVWSDDFELSGIGDNIEEALLDFENSIISDYNYFQTMATESLSEGAKELLDKYKKYLE